VILEEAFAPALKPRPGVPQRHRSFLPVKNGAQHWVRNFRLEFTRFYV